MNSIEDRLALLNQGDSQRHILNILGPPEAVESDHWFYDGYVVIVSDERLKKILPGKSLA